MSNWTPLFLSQYKSFLRRVQRNRLKRCQALSSLQNNMKTWKFHTYFQEVSVKAKSCRTPPATLQMFLRHTSQYRSLWYSVHSSLCLGTLWEDLLNCLKRSYYLAVLSLVIFYNMFQIFALSFLQLVSQLKLILVLLRSLWKRSMMQILQNETFSQV